MKWITLDRLPDRASEVESFNASLWPEFMLHGNIRNWSSLFKTLSSFQIVGLDQDDRLAAAGLCVPYQWSPSTDPPDTLDEVVFASHWPSDPPVVLCAMAALVATEYRGRGLSRELLGRMKELALEYDMEGVLIPVRPTRKAEHPDTPISVYVDWRDTDGRLADPWLRVHEELGGRRLVIAEQAFRVEGTIEDWETWTGERFLNSGSFHVPGALTPVSIEIEADLGEYVEPNVWYFHDVAGT